MDKDIEERINIHKSYIKNKIVDWIFWTAISIAIISVIIGAI